MLEFELFSFLLLLTFYFEILNNPIDLMLLNEYESPNKVLEFIPDLDTQPELSMYRISI